MPIRFEPDICGGELDFGIIICSTEDEYIDLKPNFSKTIKIINYGERQYRLVIKMLKASESKGCAVKKSLRANIHIDPLVTTIETLSVKELTIWTRACDETSIFNEFRLTIIDLTDPKRVETKRVIVRANFTFPQVLWSRREITFKYYKTHKHKDFPQWGIQNF